jgi:hypothetical protein
MKKNMGPLDKALRVLFAAVVAILYFAGVINGILAFILLLLALVFIITSLISFCPLYPLFKINTRKKE